MKTFDQYWRIFATGFCFTTFGLGGLFLSFVIIPLIRLFTKGKTATEYRVQGAIQRSFNIFCQLMKLLAPLITKLLVRRF